MRFLRVAAFIVAVASPLIAQVAVEHDGSAALQFRHAYGSRLSSWFVDYFPYKGQRALRLAVHHYHSACNGYLFITGDRIVYDPAFTPEQKDGFARMRSDLRAVRSRFAGVDLYFSSGKREDFAFISEPESGTDLLRQDDRQQLLDLVDLAFKDYGVAEKQFLRVLAGWQPAISLSPDANASAPGTASLHVLLPPGNPPNAPIDVRATDFSLDGVAADPGGLRNVKINGKLASVTRLSPQISLFQKTVELQPGPNNVAVVATSASGSSKQTQAVINRQDIAIDGVREGAFMQTTSPNIRVTGKIIGMRGVEDVQVAGVHARIQHAADGAVLFDADQIEVAPGANELRGTVQLANGTPQTFVVLVDRVRGPQPFSLSRVEAALRSHFVAPARLLELIQLRGVDFQLDEEEESTLRSLGADDSLILAIVRNQR